MKIAQYITPTAADTERGPSPSIWAWPHFGGAPIIDFVQEPRLGAYVWDDFIDSGGKLTQGSAGQYGRWATYADATDPTIADAGILGGGWKLAASTNANVSNFLSATATSFRFVNTSGVLQGRMAFECRVSISSIAASKLDFFVGLMDTLPVAADVPIGDTGGSLSTTPNLFGFHARGGATNPGDFSVAYNVASGTVQYPIANLVNTITGTAYVAGDYVKLGWVFDPNPLPTAKVSTATTANQTVGNIASPMLKFYVNGQECLQFLVRADITTGSANNSTFPGAIMGPVIAFKQQSTTASISASIDWIRIAQAAVA